MKSHCKAKDWFDELFTSQMVIKGDMVMTIISLFEAPQPEI